MWRGDNVDVKHVVMFSGGKDSTAMLLLMIKKNMQIDEICFADTGMEFPEMYKHIEKVEKYINRKIVKINIKKSWMYWFSEHEKTRGKNKGDKGYGWCGKKHCRWGTTLKRQAINKYLKSLKTKNKIIEYHGVASDEWSRTLKNKGREIVYPLVDFGLTEKQALEYCYSKGFKWDGLYENLARVSCFCCDQKRIGELKWIYNERPKLWKKLLEMEKLTKYKFKTNFSLKELDEKFYKSEKLQGRLF